MSDAEDQASDSRAFADNRYFARRAKPFDRAAFLAVLNREGGEPVQPGDEPPEDYKPAG